MKNRAAWAIVGGPIVAVALGVWLARGHVPRQTQPLSAGALRGANVLLVTVDTLRVDRVGAYGGDRGLTPAIDRLARSGLRFDRAYAHVPLTLPSHTTLMTASYPPHNGVRDNGTFHLDAAEPTLAAVLQSAGYRTAAFVGSFVLDARFGLNRGFDVYDDRMLGSSADLEVVQRPAEQVLAPAYDWIASPAARPSARPGTPWFAWVHLYDPHEPYTPPEPYRSRYTEAPYDGEIAYADAALGAFMERLQTAGALANTLVVIAADHGESLGEHGERTHGLFAYDATLHVPLVFWANGRIRPGCVRRYDAARRRRAHDSGSGRLAVLAACRWTEHPAVRQRRAAIRRRRVVFRSAERKPREELGAVDRHAARPPQIDRPAGSRAVRPGGGSC